MRVLITGGAGYIGYSLVDYLDKSDFIDELIVLDNLSKTKNNFFLFGQKLNKTKFIQGDILNLSVLDKYMDTVDKVIHLAAEVSFPFSNEDYYKYEQINQYGTLNLVRYIEDKPVKQCIYLSSSQVYGYHENCTEESPAQPVNAYARSKFLGEEYMRLLKDKMKVQVLRSANVFGFNPCMRTDAVLNQFFIDALLHKRITIFGNGEQRRSFIYIHSLVKAIAECLTGEEESEVKNLLDINLSLNDLRDYLLDRIDDLEFSYLASSSNYGSNTMLEERSDAEKEKTQEKLDLFFEDLSQTLRIST